MEHVFSLDWPYGWTARDPTVHWTNVTLLASDLYGNYPLMFVITNSDGIRVPARRRDDGRIGYGNSHLDIVNAPAPKRRVRGWMVVEFQSEYSNGAVVALTTHLFRSKDEARRCLMANSALVYIDTEEAS